MRLRDRIYGTVDVTESVLVKLIKSKPMQRLKLIDDAPRILNDKVAYNRYQHSVGVMLLLRRFNAPLEEQVSGLLHDVSHTAFSHIMDWVAGSPEKQDYQDNRHREFVYGTVIPRILNEYRMDADAVIDTERYGLLERPLPDICADRIDYALRGFARWENPKAVKPCLEGLVVHKGMFVFASERTAKIFAENYLECQTRLWGNIAYNVKDQILGRALKLAIERGIISFDDLHQKHDSYVIGKLRASRDRDVLMLLGMLRGKVKYHAVSRNADLTNTVKRRYTDPPYLSSGKLKRLSSSDSTFKETLGTYLKSPNVMIKLDYPPEVVKMIV